MRYGGATGEPEDIVGVPYGWTTTRDGGDEAFLDGAREWIARYDDGTASTADFEALMEEASDEDLDHFFDVWLHTPEKPTSW